MNKNEIKAIKRLMRIRELNASIARALQCSAQVGEEVINTDELIACISESAHILHIKPENTREYVVLDTFCEPNPSENFWQVWLSRQKIDESTEADHLLGPITSTYEGKTLQECLLLLLDKLLDDEERGIKEKFPDLSVPVWDENVSINEWDGKVTMVLEETK